jgi:hypothetical protein
LKLLLNLCPLSRGGLRNFCRARNKFFSLRQNLSGPWQKSRWKLIVYKKTQTAYCVGVLTFFIFCSFFRDSYYILFIFIFYDYRVSPGITRPGYFMRGLRRSFHAAGGTCHA